MTLMMMTMDFTLLGELPACASLQLTRSWYGVGAFRLAVSERAPGADALGLDAMLFLPDRPEVALVCEKLTRADGKLTVDGTQLKGLAKRRVAAPPLSLPTSLWRYASGAWTELTDQSAIKAAMTERDVYQGVTRPATAQEGDCWLDLSALGTAYNWESGLEAGAAVLDPSQALVRSKYQNFGWDRFVGDAESAYLHYAKNNLTDPEEARQAIPRLTLGENLRRGATLPWQARFDRLDTLFSGIGEKTGLGWDIRPDFANKRFVFSAREGRDLTAGSRRVTIARAMGNAASITRVEDAQGEVSTLYAGGYGEDENRLILCQGGEQSGLERKESYADCGSISEVDMLRLAAQKKLSPIKRTLSAAVLDTGICRYGRDYDVGDVLTLNENGYQTQTRLIAMRETYENGARTLEATFGESPVTLTAELTKMNAGTVR